MRLFLSSVLFALAACARVPPPRPEPAARAAAAATCADAAQCDAELTRLLSASADPCEPTRLEGVAAEACARGVGRGCTQLALRKLDGSSAPDAAASARALFDRACAAGDAEGCAHSGAVRLLGIGGPSDSSEGMARLRAACDQHPGRSCGIAAEALGEQGSRDHSAADTETVILLASRGCEAHDAYSCELMGDAYRRGIVVDLDGDRALRSYASACDAGDGGGCSDEATMLLEAGEAASAARADLLLERGCALGSTDACRNRAVLALRADAGRTPREEIFRRACDRGAALGCTALVEALRAHLTAANAPEVPVLLKRACHLGDGGACERIGQWTEEEQRSCDGGGTAACGALGSVLVRAPSSSAEEAEGRTLLQRACSAGDRRSCAEAQAPRPRDRLTCSKSPAQPRPELVRP